MLKRVIAGISLSLMLAVPAIAHEGAPGSGGAPADQEQHNEELGPTAVPGPPPVETPEQQKEVLYKFGVHGFLRGEGAGNFNLHDFSYSPGHSEGRLLYRIQPYAFWHPSDYLDIHLEGQGYGWMGSGPDEWQPALYQAYIEAKHPSQLAALKIGRQEFSYGSNFMLGPDAFYNGLSFDAARLRVKRVDPLTIDFLGGFYGGKSADGVKGHIAGAYGTYTASEGNALEGYFLQDTGSMEHHSGEQVDSLGFRGTAKIGQVSMEVEPVYQFGETFNTSTGRNDDISAFGWHADLTGELEAGGMHHKGWAGYAAGSGSRGAADGVSAKYEFRNPNNDTNIMGDMNVFGDLSGGNVGGHHASGLQIYTLGWAVDLTKSLNLAAAGHYFRADAVEAGLSKALGLETDVNLTYTLSDNLALILSYDHFFTGAFFRGATGSDKDIHYGYAMLMFNLEKAKMKEGKKGA